VPQSGVWRHHEKNNSEITQFPAVRDLYLNSLAIKGFSENTLRVRRVYIGIFLDWCKTNGIANAAEVTTESIVRFQEHLFLHRKQNGQRLSLSSQYSRLALIRPWLRWVHRKGFIPENPTKDLELPRTAYKLRTILTRLQMDKVLAQPNVRSFVGMVCLKL
jgi:integrase/recombinase XerD